MRRDLAHRDKSHRRMLSIIVGSGGAE
jgi:hypothetical protein